MSIQKSTRPQLLITQALAEAKKALPKTGEALSAQEIQSLPTPLRTLADSFAQADLQGADLLGAFEKTLRAGLAQSLQAGSLVDADLSPEIESLLSFSVTERRATAAEPLSFEQNLDAAAHALQDVKPTLDAQLGAFKALKSLSDASQSAAPEQAKYFAGVLKDRSRSIRKAADAAVTHYASQQNPAELATVLKEAISVHQAVNPRSTSVKALQKRLKNVSQTPAQNQNLMGDFFQQHVPALVLKGAPISKGAPVKQEPDAGEPIAPGGPIPGGEPTGPVSASPKKIVEKAQVVILEGFYNGFGNMRDEMLEMQDALGGAASENVKAQTQLTLRAFEAGLGGLSGIKSEVADIAQQMTLEIFSPSRDERLAAEMQMFSGVSDRFQKLSDYAASLERRRDYYPSKPLEISALKLFVEGADAMEARIETLDQLENPSVHESAELEALTLMHEGGDSISERIEEMEDLMSRARMTAEAHANMTMSVTLLKSLLTAMKRFDA